MDQEFWCNKNVVITGGSGFVGRWLVRTLVSTKAKVQVIDIVFPAIKDKGVEFHQIDLCNIGEIRKYLQQNSPEILIHLAGQAGVPECEENPAEAFEKNIYSTFNILEACRRYGQLKSIVMTSSNHIYGNQRIFPTPEDAPLNGVGTYAVTKLCGDLIGRLYGKTYGLPVSVARITNSYGGDDPHGTHVITASILAILKGEQPVIKRSGMDRKGFLYVKDTVNGILMLAEQTARREELYGEALNFAPENSVSIKELVREIISVAEKDLEPIIKHPSVHFETENLDSTKARQLIGWTPQYDLRRGLLETINWFKEYLIIN